MAFEPFGRGGGEILGERGDLEAVVVLDGVGLGHHSAQERLGAQVVRAVHAEHVVDEELADLLFVVRDARHQELGVVRQGRRIAVPDGQVLGPYRRSVGGLPAEPRLRDRRGHAAPHHRVAEAGEPQQLGHLGDVAEHVGQVADVHGAAVRRPLGQAELQVADDGLARDQELVHQDVPRAHGEPTGRRQGANPSGRLGTDLEIVVDHGHLPVEEEPPVARVGLHECQEAVEEVDQVEAERLEGLVPLTVPVGVGDDRDSAGAHPQRLRA